ncbi:MAG: hypothetical protein IJU37_05260 [Desulfovibrio sp.]|nr:hypothetical protein [Desulfovibrio sp.]
MNARIPQDLHALLHADAPGSLLAEAVGRQASWLPCFLADADNIPAGPPAFHSGSVLTHLMCCMNAVAGNPLAVWMAMSHDAGKLTTPSALWPRHYGHEQRGAILADIWARQLGLSHRHARAGSLAALLHMKAGRYALLRPGTRYTLLRSVAQSGFFREFWLVVDADTKSNISTKATEDWRKVQALPVKGLHPELALQRRIEFLARNGTQCYNLQSAPSTD